jgi:PTS system nitrogen regulatory IIA component
VIEPFLTASQLAEILGFAPGTVVDWAERGELPSFKIGGRLRFRESELAEWLEQKRQGNGGERNASYATPSPGGVVYGLPATQKEDEDAS